MVSPSLSWGSIPANAGEPQCRQAAAQISRVYPRERGGATSGTTYSLSCLGLSPRTRGSPEVAEKRRDAAGSIPANAGEPQAAQVGGPQLGVYPRERGGAWPARARRPAS